MNVAMGGTVSYDLVLVNSGNSVAVYQIVPQSVNNLVVTVDQPVVTIPAGSSKVVTVKATAGNLPGIYAFKVDVNSNGELVKELTLTANVSGSNVAMPSNIVILTVVLAIIFVVLLIVLIVLLTRKPAKAEEFGESYY